MSHKFTFETEIADEPAMVLCVVEDASFDYDAGFGMQTEHSIELEITKVIINTASGSINYDLAKAPEWRMNSLYEEAREAWHTESLGAL